MTPDRKLDALFAAEAPPARDYAFQARVAQRIAARRAWMTVGALVPWVIAASAVLWGLSPVVAPFTDSMEAAIAPTAVVLAVGGATLLVARWMARRFSAA